ncbi:serine racemase VanT catalytic subunit [Thomasclavelia cocleata]|jgi:alanine racemase|uniref:serine racemase VanT catalytic subunit n=1 Tax=Thomasclavelia cocleata TaxID=69824 RepID=UPI00242D441D|nr:serine racemase VanT catalytic subunit [Thomasclavelia cocleata]MCI9630237.1 serine racemase VanT catalytic subunit [Thomasclavelia cocleata]
MVSISTSRSWVEIDLDALSHNVNYLSSLLKPKTKFMAVVKADGYGHGLITIARHCQRIGITAYAVATIDEGIKLRKAGIRGEILILGFTHPIRAFELYKYHLIQSIIDSKYACELSWCGFDIDVHVKIDSGMHRLGFDVNDIDSIEELYEYNNLHIKGYFTHLCVCDSNKRSDISFTKSQINSFNRLINNLKKYNDVGKIHIQSSYGLINYPEIDCDYARIGIFMYGIKSSYSDYLKIKLDLSPVLSIKSRIATIHHLVKGTKIGYGLTYQVTKDSIVATIPIGYGDGIPRQLSSSGYVLVKGQKCPIIGRICMDQMLVDVSRVKNLTSNEVVTIVGKDGNNEIRIEQLALAADTISNEILCQIKKRLPRIYKGANYIKIK